MAALRRGASASRMPTQEQRTSRVVADNETTLRITLVGPAYKDNKSGGYRVESAKAPPRAPTIIIPAPGRDKSRVSAGHVARLVKNVAVSNHLYKTKDGSCVGKRSNVLIQDAMNSKNVSFIASNNPAQNGKISTEKLWEKVNERRKRMEGSQSEKKTVKIYLSVGAMKEDDEVYQPVLREPEEDEPEEDRSFSQGQESEALNSPAVKDKTSAKEMRATQDELAKVISDWLERCFENKDCELYHAFTLEHFQYYSRSLKVDSFAGQLCYKRWALKDDDPETWPRIKDLPEAK